MRPPVEHEGVGARAAAPAEASGEHPASAARLAAVGSARLAAARADPAPGQAPLDAEPNLCCLGERKAHTCAHRWLLAPRGRRAEAAGRQPERPESRREEVECRKHRLAAAWGAVVGAAA